MSDDYEKREREIYETDLRRINSAKPKDARKAQAQWIQHCKTDPELVAERVSWLLAGHYGKGAYDAAWQIVRSNFISPTSRCIELIGQLEWFVPRAYLTAALNRITAFEQLALDNAVRQVINEAIVERDREDS